MNWTPQNLLSGIRSRHSSPILEKEFPEQRLTKFGQLEIGQQVAIRNAIPPDNAVGEVWAGRYAGEAEGYDIFWIPKGTQHTSITTLNKDEHFGNYTKPRPDSVLIDEPDKRPVGERGMVAAIPRDDNNSDFCHMLRITEDAQQVRVVWPSTLTQDNAGNCVLTMRDYNSVNQIEKDGEVRRDTNGRHRKDRKNAKGYWNTEEYDQAGDKAEAITEKLLQWSTKGLPTDELWRKVEFVKNNFPDGPKFEENNWKIVKSLSYLGKTSIRNSDGGIRNSWRLRQGAKRAAHLVETGAQTGVTRARSRVNSVRSRVRR